MSIVSAYSPQNYAGDGSTTIFSTVFVFQLPADVSVHLLTNATQTTVAWVLGTDYTLSGGGSPAAVGAVTAVVPPALGTTLIISRVIPFTQLDHWQQNDAYPANSNRVENALDKITMALQEVTAGPISPSSLAPGTPSFSTFLRGDPLWTNTLIGPSGAVVLATDTTAVFTAEMNANASIRVGTGVGGQAGYSFAVDGSANPWEMKWVYDDGLGKMGWQVFGQSIRGTFDNTGLDVTGTVNATLFTGAADASLITTGTIATARLGSGSGSSNSFLNGLGQFTVPAGGGGGVNTTTTGTFTIAAVSSPQTVPVTSVTGITVGTYLQISDGAHTIIGHVTVISSLNLTVVTDSIAIGSAGNTMASGAAVQLSNVPGQNTIILSDHDNLATPISLITLTGGASDFSGLGIYNQVELYMITPPTGGQVPIRAGILRNALSATSFAGSENLTAGFVGFPTSATGASSLSSASAQYQVPFCSTFGGGKATGVTWGLVGPNNITPASLTPALLNATNSPTDTYALTYDLGSTHFKWVSIPSVGSGTTAQFYRGDNTFTNSLTGPINIDLSSSTTFRIGVANIFGGTTPVQAYMEPVVSGTPTVLPLQIASQVALGGTQYNTIDTTNIIEMLQVNAIARATAFRSTCGPWLEIYELGVGGGATTIHLANGNYQRFTSFGSNVTITLDDNTPLPNARRFTSELTLEFNAMSTFDVTWPMAITWANGGVAPTVANSGLTAAGINVVKLIRRQGQTQWIGFVENPAASTPYTDAQARSAVLNSTYLLDSSTVGWSIVSGTSATPSVKNGSITNAMLAGNIATSKLVLPGGTTAFLRADGSWQVPPGTGGGGSFSPANAYVWTNGSGQQFQGTNLFTAQNTFSGAPQTFVSSSFGSPVGGSATGFVSFNNYYANDTRTGPETACAARIDFNNTYLPSGSEEVMALTVSQLNNSAAGAGQGCVKIGLENYQNITSGFSIAFQQLAQHRRINGGDASGTWLNSYSPCQVFSATPDAQGITHSFGSGFVRIGECNYGNTWAELGFVDDRPNTGHWVAGLEFFPDWLPGETGATGYTKFNAQWAIAIGGAAAGPVGATPKNWTGILFSEDGLAGGGIGINMHGGSSSGTAPAVGVNFQNHLKTGINFAGSAGGAPTAGGGGTAATIDADASSRQPAITLASGQAICFVPSSGVNTGVYIEYSGGHLRATVNGGSSWTNII